MDGEGYHECFCVCRHCGKATIFVLTPKEVDTGRLAETDGVEKCSIGGSVNSRFNVERFINLKDFAAVSPPEHLPPAIGSAFQEGATCMAVQCFNAGATMFRLCIDLVTEPLLPAKDCSGLNAFIRRSLGPRLQWLFDNQLLPEALRELATCVREDGNDGAHRGTLSKADAEDIFDFAFALLERLCTEPERLRLAQQRRAARRTATP